LLAGGAAAGMGQAAGAAQADIPLGTPDGFMAIGVSAVGGNRYCVSGSVFDDTGPSNAAMVVLVDAARRAVLWKVSIPYGKDYVGNQAVACAAAGNGYAAVTQDSTNSVESENQTRVTLSRISAAGKLERHETIEAGYDEWFYGLDAGPAGLAVVGGTSGSAQRGGPFGTFVARFGADFAPAGLSTLASGAFWLDSAARFDGAHLIVSGQFMPNKGAGRDAFAASKIDPRSGKYVWSTYALPGDTQSARAWVAADGGVVTAGLTPNALAVAVLDRNGKLVRNFSLKKPLCSLRAVAVDGSRLDLIGNACGGDEPTVRVPVDLDAKTAGPAQPLGGKLRAVGVDGKGWVGVATVKGQPVLRRVAP
uniref:hypothetical protein n=1 Tax=Burkholderia sp. Ac-20379 TaxID=2703900 RepID=UPI00197FE341